MSAGIVERMAKRYGGNPSVVAWQIDNEFGCTDTIRCYFDNCRRARPGTITRTFISTKRRIRSIRRFNTI